MKNIKGNGNRMKNLGLRLLPLPAFLVVIFILTSCAKEEKKAAPPPGAPVTVAAAVRKDVPVEIEAIGSVEAVLTISVKSLVTGALAEAHFREGQEVGKGDLLFTIDPRPFEASLREAQANLAKDSAMLEAARKDYNRFTELLKGGYVTQAQYDRAKSNAEALEASVKGDEAAAANAKLNLEYCFIHSPVDGRTGSILIQKGNIIKANDDKAMVVIYRIRPVYVSFSVPEKYLSGIRKLSAERKLEAVVEIPPPAAGPLSSFAPAVSRGLLTFIDNGVDRTTGTITLKGTFENRDGLLWPGQFVNTVLKLYTEKDAVVVPTRAVETSQSGQYAFVVRPDNTAEERRIVTGISFGPEAASQTVIEKGISAGETVVTDGQLQLVTGRKVEVVGRVDSGDIQKANVSEAAGVSGTARKQAQPHGGGTKNGY